MIITTQILVLTFIKTTRTQKHTQNSNINDNISSQTIIVVISNIIIEDPSIYIEHSHTCSESN